MISQIWDPLFQSMGFPGSSAGKESACNTGDTGSIAGSGRSPGEGIDYPLQYSWTSLVAQMVKNPPAVWETWVQSLGREDPGRRAWQPTPVFLSGESPWTEEPGRLQSTGSQRVGHNWVTKHSTAQHSTSKACVLGVPQTIHRFSDCLWELTGLSVQWHPWLWYSKRI